MTDMSYKHEQRFFNNPQLEKDCWKKNKQPDHSLEQTENDKWNDSGSFALWLIS